MKGAITCHITIIYLYIFSFFLLLFYFWTSLASAPPARPGMPPSWCAGGETPRRICVQLKGGRFRERTPSSPCRGCCGLGQMRESPGTCACCTTARAPAGLACCRKCAVRASQPRTWRSEPPSRPSRPPRVADQARRRRASAARPPPRDEPEPDRLHYCHAVVYGRMMHCTVGHHGRHASNNSE